MPEPEAAPDAEVGAGTDEEGEFQVDSREAERRGK